MKRALIDRDVEVTKPPDETVVGLIQLFTGLNHPLLPAAVELCAQAVPHGIAHVNHPANPRTGFDRQIVQRTQDAIFVQTKPAILVNAVGIGLDVIRRGNGRVKSFNGFILDGVDVLGQPCNRVRQGFTEFTVVGFQHGFAVPIHAAGEPHFTQHHFRMGGEVFVDGKLFLPVVGEIHRGFPSRAARRFTGAQFAQHHDVGGHFRASVFLEGGIGQPDGTEEFSFLG